MSSPKSGSEPLSSRAGDELCLKPAFREGVALRRQDIREEMPAGAFHLVLCRNLAFTYFGPPLQASVLDGIHERLHPGGFLILGAHEELPAGSDRFERVVPGEPIYHRS